MRCHRRICQDSIIAKCQLCMSQASMYTFIIKQTILTEVYTHRTLLYCHAETYFTRIRRGRYILHKKQKHILLVDLVSLPEAAHQCCSQSTRLCKVSRLQTILPITIATGGILHYKSEKTNHTAQQTLINPRENKHQK